MHRAVVRAHSDAVLVEVGIRGVLEAPALVPELDRDDAEILARWMGTEGIGRRTARISFVLDAELAGRIFLACRRLAGSGNLSGSFSGFERLIVISRGP
jgi:hypothetical protein